LHLNSKRVLLTNIICC